MLEKEYNFYKANKNKLLSSYGGKFVAIVGEEVVASFSSEIEAYKAMGKKYGVGNFLLQYCDPSGENHVQRFYSRVAFR